MARQRKEKGGGKVRNRERKMDEEGKEKQNSDSPVESRRLIDSVKNETKIWCVNM